MKKSFLLLFTIFSITQYSFGQNITKAQTYAALRQYENAKTEIDQVTASDKGAKNAEAIYLKAQIYTAITLDSTLTKKYPDAKQIAFDVLKMYLTLDPKYKFLQADNYGVINTLYAISFNDGAAQYNLKKYAEALNSFQQAVNLSDMMIQNKWSKIAMDTSAILYAGISAQNAKNDDVAIAMYTRLVDKEIKADGYIGIYEFVVDYYRKKNDADYPIKNDAANFQKYIAIGKKIYPEDNFWLASEMESVKHKGDFSAVVNTYESMLAKQPSYAAYFELGNTIYDYLYPKDTTKVPQNREVFEQKMIDAYTKAANAKTDAGIPYFSVGNHYYNKAIIINKTYNKIRNSKKPEDVKMRDELLKQSNNYVDQAITAYEKACDRFASNVKLTVTEKFCYKNSVSALIDLFKDKKSNYKATTPEYKKYEDMEKKWTLMYDKLDKMQS